MTSLRILMVEDSPDDADLILRELRRGGYEVLHKVVQSAPCVAEALASDDWDIVVSDFNLPRNDFADVVNAVQARNPDLPFLVVSGAVGEEVAVTLMHSGAADLILKGNLSRLLPAIERELAAAEECYRRRATEQRFRDIVEVSGDWIWETDADHRFTFFSSRDDAGEWSAPFRSLGRSCWEAVGADIDADPHWRGHKDDLDARRPFRNFLITFTSPSGERFHVSISGVPGYGRSGAFCGYRGTASNQTLVVEAFWRAENAEALLRDAVESVSQGFVICDADDRVVIANEAYRHLFPAVADMASPGVRFGDILRAGVAKRVYADAFGREAAWLSERLDARHAPNGSYVASLSDGRSVLVTERRMRNGGIAGLSVDITALPRGPT